VSSPQAIGFSSSACPLRTRRRDPLPSLYPSVVTTWHLRILSSVISTAAWTLSSPLTHLISYMLPYCLHTYSSVHDPVYIASSSRSVNQSYETLSWFMIGILSRRGYTTQVLYGRGQDTGVRKPFGVQGNAAQMNALNHRRRCGECSRGPFVSTNVRRLSKAKVRRGVGSRIRSSGSFCGQHQSW
jgi:hypothetical protein